MQVNTNSVAILTKSILRSEIEVLKTRLDTPGAGPGDPRYLGTMRDLVIAVRVLESRIKELEGAGK